MAGTILWHSRSGGNLAGITGGGSNPCRCLDHGGLLRAGLTTEDMENTEG